MVYWYALDKARREDRLSLKICITKWVSGDTTTVELMVQQK